MQGRNKQSPLWESQGLVVSTQHGSVLSRVGKPDSASGTWPQAFGSNLWFDVPFMLVVLALGVSALSTSGTSNSGTLYERVILLLFYTFGILLNLVYGMLSIRGVSTFLDTPIWRGKRLLVLLNPAFDLIFALGVFLLYIPNTRLLLAVLLALASTRLLGQLMGKFTPVVVLTAGLAGALFDIYRFFGSIDFKWPLVQQVEVLIVVVSFLILGYLTRLRGKEQGAEVSRLLEEARMQAEHDAGVLSVQVLSLNLLQSSIKAINSAIELDDLLNMIVNNAVRVLKAEQSTIGLIDEQSGDLVIRCATGIDSSQLKGRHFLPGVGVAGWVIQHGRPALIQDVSVDPRYISLDNDGFVGRRTRSMLCAPLIIEQRVIGALSVTHSLPNALTEDDQRLITSFAEQATLAVYKSQLLAETTRQRNELKRREELITGLNVVTQSVLGSLDLPLILDTIIPRMGELVSFDHALIYLRNERTGELQLSALGGEGPHAASLELREGMPALEWWEDASQPRVFRWRSDGMSLLSFRLVNDNESLGCILLARKEATPFSTEELDAIEKLADAATIAILKARLFSQVISQQEQTTALYRLMLSVNSAHDRGELATVVVRELRKITSAKSAALLMEDYEQSQITVWATDGEWARKDASGIALNMHGDLFMSSTLASLIEAEPLDLLLIPNAPQQVKDTFGCNNCVTIPLSNSNRIYGLLVIEPKADPPVEEETKEMVRLAISHSTVALERTELFEATVRSMRQSGMLYSIAARVQGSLDASTVIDMTLQGTINALPLQSCELYLFEEDRKQLRRYGKAIKRDTGGTQVALGPETVSPNGNPVLFEVLHSPGLMLADLVSDPAHIRPQSETSDGQNDWYAVPAYGLEDASEPSPVLLARLMGSEEALGIMRFTVNMSPEEFVRNHATFCQTLLTHAGSALERSRLYSELLESKREIEAVVLSTSNGVLVADADLNVIISNDLANRLLDLPTNKDQPQSLANFVKDDDLLKMVHDCITNSMPGTIDLDLTLDKELRIYSATAHPILGGGKDDVFGAVLTLRDITAERAHERAKSDFLSMISHELRTPLNSIYGFLDITLSGKTGPLSDLQVDFLNTAKQETAVLKRLISDLLDYSRLESGTLRMEMEPLDLSTLITRVIRSATARMTEDNLVLTSDVVPKGLMITGDEIRLQQVFDNLLDNAAKFTDPGGLIALSCQVGDDQVTISVRDNGCGIPPSQVDSIFDRFFQADNHSSRRKRGQGLGLAICKNIVETHDGRIWVESTPGVGTTMHVQLPIYSFRTTEEDLPTWVQTSESALTT